MRGDAAALDGLDAAARRRLPADAGRLERYVRLETPTGAADALDALAELVVADARAAGFRGGRVPTADPASGDAVVLDLPGRGPRAATPRRCCSRTTTRCTRSARCRSGGTATCCTARARTT